jgi:anti-sigma factor RsiW
MAINNNTIDRNNYEEYFLMYVDNELSATDRALVEAFIHENTDLAPELEALQQTVLQAPPFGFPAKDSLLKETTTINADNCIEFFLLYTDGELDEAGQRQVEAYVAAHPEANVELERLLQTRMDAADIRFENKTALYKNTGESLINRANYTEYFVLYADGELSVADRKMVETFAATDAALQAELNVFMQTRLEAATDVTFDNKLALYKNIATTLINRSNYTEYFVLYADDELNDAQRKEVERFAASDKHLQQELAAFLSTQNQPDLSVTFPDKSILYRKERKPRVVPMWLRYAAAAAVLLFVALFAINQGGGKTGDEKDNPLAKEVKPSNPQKENNKNNSVAPQQSPVNVEPGAENMADLQEAPVTNGPVTTDKAQADGNNKMPAPYKSVFNDKINNTGVTKTPAIRNTNEGPQRRMNEEKQAPQKNSEVLVSNNDKQPLPAPIKQIVQPQNEPEKEEAIAKVDVPEVKTPVKTDVAPTVPNVTQFTMPDEKETANVTVMNMAAGDAGKKGGLRGFGRKVGRFFERKVKNLGSGPVTIGGFDVAVAKQP